ncbi:MAG: TetM/TetW/TetO/TetS family tetracycline resistance ribosomal protection protein [Lachnospiraceae bacterium]|nr:TetM/TetW/TetO/TetS family tetracycline resistance ribosomal protection protein [Lachnospiraceae bacterium]
MKKLVIGMIAHVDAGKTTLSEALLFHAGKIRQMGRVDNRNSFFDSKDVERERGITVFSKQAVLTLPDCVITLTDTPGHVDFSPEAERAISVLDYAVLVISGTEGVQNHTVTLWNMLAHYNIPAFLFVNKTDRPDVSESDIMASLKSTLSDSIVNMTHPDEEEISLCDESLLQEYLESGTVRKESLPAVIKKRGLFPCFFGSALKDTGVSELLDALSELTVMPAASVSFGAIVYKITHDADKTRVTHMKITGGTIAAKETINDVGKIDMIRIYSGERYETVKEAGAGDLVAVTGLTESKAGDVYGSAVFEKASLSEPVLSYRLVPMNTEPALLLPAVMQLEEEEPTLHVLWEERAKEIRIQVMGTVQLEILSRELKSRFGADVTFDTGDIVYKETIANTVEGVGHFEPLRHYAEVHLILEPLPAGSGLEFCTDLSEDLLAGNWQRHILSALARKKHKGVLTGSVLTNVRMTLVGGKAHPKHTGGGDFRQASCRAVRQGLMQAENVLLEPYYSFVITIPADSIGRVMHALTELNADFERDADSRDGSAVLKGYAPVSSFQDFPAMLPTLCKGKGHIFRRVSGYRPCRNSAEVISKIGYDPDADLANPSYSVFCTHGSGYPVMWNEVFEHMHVPSVLYDTGENLTESLVQKNPESLMETLDLALGTEEIDRIIKSSSHANEKAGKKAPLKREEKLYRSTEPKKRYNAHWVLVDGYNIIHAWPELSELSKQNMDSARGKLLDILTNYAAYKGCELIAVFDAYLVKGHDEEAFDYNGIHVVFTKEAETADGFIERFTHVHANDYRITVATSDGLEQIIIRGAGSLVLSAREFLAEVRESEAMIREHIESN